MNLRTKLLTSIAGVLLFKGLVSAQPPPPAAGGGKATRSFTPKSLRNLPESDWFLSEEGRFKVALPKSLSGFAALAPKDLGYDASGAYYQWRVEEGEVTVRFLEFRDDEHAKTFFDGMRSSIVKVSGGKVVSEREISHGVEFVIDAANGQRILASVLRFENTGYTLMAAAAKEKGAEKLILSAFTSFSRISLADLEAQSKKLIENSTPSALPQSPVAPKEKSDVYDKGLSGFVKTVTEESEDRSGTWGTQGRKMSSIEDYDETGFLTKRISYDSTGKPFEVTVYGYLDGARVSNWKMISYDSDPPLGMAARPASQTKPRDNRYQYKYLYKYVNGMLREKTLISNNDAIWMRYVTINQDRTREELVYDEKGELNMKFVYMLDDKRRDVEEVDVDLHGFHKGDQRYKLRYESFDMQGNWTKRVTSKLVDENGKSVTKDWYITYRTITYH